MRCEGFIPPTLNGVRSRLYRSEAVKWLRARIFALFLSESDGPEADGATVPDCQTMVTVPATPPLQAVI